jgi:hypothetical protein
MNDEDEDGHYLIRACQELERLDKDEKSQRGPVDDIWRRIAKGTLSEAAAAAWAFTIADRVVRYVIDDRNPPEERPKRALKAMGFFGVIDKNYDERNAIEQFLVFDLLASKLHRNGRRATRREKLTWMRAQGFYEGVKDNAAMQRIDSLEENSR